MDCGACVSACPVGAIAPDTKLEPKQLPDLKGRRVFLSSGTVDPIVPDDHPARLADLLRRAGADVTLQAHPASHGLVPADFAGACDFLARRPPG